VDFDGDGILDLVSGSYDPGELYWFRGLGKGKFAAREVIRDKSGKPILRVPNQKGKVESFGSWMAMVDWNDRGVLDILVGTFDGMMFLRRNVGTRTKPVYSETNEWVMVGDKRLRVPGGAHANPVIVDWDGDGLWDIITGSADGGVYWYRNIGTKKEPRFGPPVALVPKHEGPGYSEVLSDEEPARPGVRSQIAVTDYDGDGKLDVLLGDFRTCMHIKPTLTALQKKEFDAKRAERDHVLTQLLASMDGLRAKWKTVMKDVPQSEWETPENSAKWQAMYKEMTTSAAYKDLQKQDEKVEKELAAFVVPGKSAFGDASIVHGHVWLFRRK
jgi:hypothetical protein